MSSSASNTDPFDPAGSKTWGSFDHALIRSSFIPQLISFLPNGSSLIDVSSQLVRSASPSNGDAEAWTPLSEPSGDAFKPSSCHASKMVRRMEPSGALEGSVGPRTLPRKSAQESASGLHSTE